MVEKLIKSLEIISKHKEGISIDKEMSKMGFETTNGNFNLSVFLCPYTKNLDPKDKRFVIRNFEKFSELYCKLKETDILLGRDSQLTKYFFKGIESFPDDAKYVCMHAVYSGKEKGLSDDSIIEFSDRAIYNAMFNKSGDTFVRNPKWPKFKAGLDRVWLDRYISNEFDKDEAWSYIKKIGVHDPRYSESHDQDYNIWRPKNSKVGKVQEIIKTHLKYGGVAVMKFNKSFKCFMPIATEEGSNRTKLTIEKSADGKGIKNVWLEGTASNTKVDREMERMTSSFVQKMASTAQGLTVFNDHKHDLDNAIGHIVESGGDENEFNIKVKLEHPDNNQIVKSIISKIDAGIRLGFSIYGSVYEAERAYDKALEREIYEISDGELEEVSVTPFPAAYDTWASAIVKSLKKGKDDSDNKDNIVKALNHNSKVSDDEPAWGVIDKSSVPRNGNANYGEAADKSSWEYPHHWVKSGKKNSDGVYVSGDMYLHRGGLNVAWAEAQGKSGKKASPSVIAHLQRHRTALGLTDVGKTLMSIGDTIDGVNEAKEIVSNHSEKILNLIKEFKSALKNSSSEKLNVEENIKLAEEVMKEFTEKTVTLIKEILDHSTDSKEKSDG